jgi:hypothetical protein
MNRIFSTITVLAMLLLAIGLCVKQTFDAWGVADDRTVALLFAAEGIVAGLVIATGGYLLRNRFARQKEEKPRRRQVPATV